MVDRIWRALAEYGPLTGLFSRHDIEEVFIEGDRVSYIEEGGRLLALNEPTSERENRTSSNGCWREPAGGSTPPPPSSRPTSSTDAPG
jgi:hypothetical protein